MNRTEVHIVRKNHKLHKYCDDMCYKSKNLYNVANFTLREQFFNNKKLNKEDRKYYSYMDLNKMLKTHDCFKELPAKTSQQVIIGLSRNWSSMYSSIKRYNKNKIGYTGAPKIPKYKDKNGRNVVRFDYTQIKIENGFYYFQQRKGIKIKPNKIKCNIPKENFRLLEIVPMGNCYKICIIYRIDDIPLLDDNDRYMSIDLGLNNFATCVNNIGKQPIVINGKILKSVNQYYNKLLSKYKSYVGNKSSNNIKRIGFKRNNIVETHLHKISTYIVNYCVENKINTIFIGNNFDWKRNSKMSKIVNQSFIQIPHGKFIEKLAYKCENYGITLVELDERYTSKSSFIDNDILPEEFGNYTFSGKRVKRGMYMSKANILINADVNGAYNILRKGNPKFIYNDRIEGVSFHPIKINIC